MSNPFCFARGRSLEFVQPGRDLHFLVADCGIKKATAETVAYLAAQRERDPKRIDAAIEEIGRIALKGTHAFKRGDLETLGQMMNADQSILASLDLSHSALDQLIDAARQAGALGAKLTGGGKGGNMLALVTPETQENVKSALLSSGATAVYQTNLKGGRGNG